MQTHEKNEKGIRNLVRKPQGKRPLRRPRSNWEQNIKDYEGVEWNHIAQDKIQSQLL